VQIFWNNPNEFKLYSGRNEGEIEVRKCLLSFGAEYFSYNLLSKNLKIQIYRTIILPVVLYGCKTWSLALRDERRLRVFENKVLRRVFENRVLRRIFGPKRDKVTGEWRKLHN
jgi:hypothetical protein